MPSFLDMPRPIIPFRKPSKAAQGVFDRSIQQPSLKMRRRFHLRHGNDRDIDENPACRMLRIRRNRERGLGGAKIWKGVGRDVLREHAPPRR
jgi:hypothetical protein